MTQAFNRFVRKDSGDVLSLYEIRQENPDVSFPRYPGNAALNPFGFAGLWSTDYPGDGYVEAHPIQRPDGEWEQAWKEAS